MAAGERAGHNRDDVKMRLSRLLAFLLLALAMAAALPVRAQADSARLKSVDWRQTEDGIVVDIRTDKPVADYKSFILDGPPRIVVDVPGLQSAFSGEQRVAVDTPPVQHVRHSGYPDKVRFVVDAEKASLSLYSVSLGANGLSILVGSSGAASSAGASSGGRAKRQAGAAEPSGPAVTAKQADAEAATSGAGPSRAQDKPANGGAKRELQEIEVALVEGQVVIQVKADGAVPDYKTFTMDNPSRIVFDISNLKSRFAGERRVPIKGGNGKQVRYFNQADNLRVVVETDKKNLGKYSAFQTETGLVIAVGDADFSQKPPPVAAAPAPRLFEPERPSSQEIEKPTWAASAVAAAVRQRTLEALEPEDPNSFEIKRFDVNGNTVLSPMAIENTLKPFVGRRKKAEDVEAARDALEKQYHDKGYPTVLVNIPEQSVETGVVRLEVIESKIGRVRVTGNEYFTMEKIQKELPSLREGEILYLPRVQEDLAGLNRNPDIKVAPVLAPGARSVERRVG